LQRLQVQPEANSTSYNRDSFRHWIDADGDGCDAREEVLLAESKTKAKTGQGCALTSGKWISAYDNKPFTKASQLDIDHMVPLKEAWESGASDWTDAQREEFANDLDFGGSLIAVSASSNRSKGDKDPSQWIPSNRSYACTYGVSWAQVKIRWSLSIDSKELSALKGLLAKCPKSKLYAVPPIAIPEDVEPNPEPSEPSNTPEPNATPTPTPSPTSTGALDPKFSSCSAAKAAGYGPYVRGVDPEYDWYRDGDNDGTVCE
jgi:hypothetical protein